MSRGRSSFTSRVFFKAVKAAWITSVGVRGKDSVCVVTQKKVSDKLLDQTSVTHLFPITKFLGLLASGMIATMSSERRHSCKEQEAIELLTNYSHNLAEIRNRLAERVFER